MPVSLSTPSICAPQCLPFANENRNNRLARAWIFDAASMAEAPASSSAATSQDENRHEAFLAKHLARHAKIENRFVYALAAL
jgi:hypothetical protein